MQAGLSVLMHLQVPLYFLMLRFYSRLTPLNSADLNVIYVNALHHTPDQTKGTLSFKVGNYVNCPA